MGIQIYCGASESATFIASRTNAALRKFQRSLHGLNVFGTKRGDIRCLDGSKFRNQPCESGEEIVPLLTIDDLYESRRIAPDAIKIETEGYEFEILRGDARHLNLNRPVIFLELHLHSKYGNPTFFPYPIEEFADYIATLNYRIFNLFDEEIASLPRYAELIPAEHHRLVLLPRNQCRY